MWPNVTFSERMFESFRICVFVHFSSLCNEANLACWSSINLLLDVECKNKRLIDTKGSRKRHWGSDLSSRTYNLWITMES